MTKKVLFRAGVKQHKGILTGIFLLNFMVVLSLGVLLTVWNNSNSYIRAELERLGYGDMTLWVHNVPDSVNISDEITDTGIVKDITTDSLIFTDYEVNGNESDSQGQLIVYDKRQQYRVFTDDLKGYRQVGGIAEGDAYVPASFVSMYGAQVGDELICRVARNGNEYPLTIRGFYEDPMMGSSMIGMKGILIGSSDYEAIRQVILRTGIDALAETGAMIHITGKEEIANSAELLHTLEQNTSISNYLKFSYSREVIIGFMMVLQNVFRGILFAFVAILFVVVMIVLGHTIHSGIVADYEQIGILKTMGMKSSQLRQIQLMQYMTGAGCGMFLGVLLTAMVAKIFLQMTITSTGLRIPAQVAWNQVLPAVCIIGVILIGFIWVQTRTILMVTPMQAIRREVGTDTGSKMKGPISGRQLLLSIAVRQVASHVSKYIGITVIAMLLVCFAQAVGRMSSWLGSDGKGMMDAFNPADHDIGVQMFGVNTDEDAAQIIRTFTGITEQYELAMPDVTIAGTGYTANVITEPQRFHILEGQTSKNDDEIVITEFIAADYGVGIGDTLTVTGDLGSAAYRISGIYSCANDMGANLGMSKAGYLRIGKDDARLWCHHYFLEDASLKYEITNALEQTFGGDVHVHENTWPGLFGIIAAMKLLFVVMYIAITAFVLIVTILTGSRLLKDEQKDIGIYKALGMSSGQLRITFALRFTMMAAVGSILGTVVSAGCADLLISMIMKIEGISNFAAHPTLLESLLPGCFVTLLFFVCAYAAGHKIRSVGSNVLISE